MLLIHMNRIKLFYVRLMIHLSPMCLFTEDNAPFMSERNTISRKKIQNVFYVLYICSKCIIELRSDKKQEKHGYFHGLIKVLVSRKPFFNEDLYL